LHSIYQREKFKIANSFNRAAQSYDQAAELQYGIGDKLLNLLNDTVIDPKIIVDLGGGTGYFAKRLLKRYPDAKIILADLADDMLSVAQQQLVLLPIELINADFDQLPLANNSVDVIFANMSLQWSLNFKKTLRVLQDILKPNGHIIFSLPIAGTLRELHTSLQQLDRNADVNAFYTADEIIEQVKMANFHVNYQYNECIKLFYNDIAQLTQQLKATGANHIKFKLASFFPGKQHMMKLAMAYEKYRNRQRLLPASYHIHYLCATKHG